MSTNRYEFTFYPGEDNEYEHYTCLTLEAPEGLHAADFHRMCRNFALVLGYAPETIDEYFGPERDDAFLENIGHDN